MAFAVSASEWNFVSFFYPLLALLVADLEHGHSCGGSVMACVSSIFFIVASVVALIVSQSSCSIFMFDLLHAVSLDQKSIFAWWAHSV